MSRSIKEFEVERIFKTYIFNNQPNFIQHDGRMKATLKSLRNILSATGMKQFRTKIAGPLVVKKYI